MTDPHLQSDPHLLPDERLCRAAEGLVAAGCVFEVRLHQDGAVVTGIVRTVDPTGRPMAAHRIYIRRATGSVPRQSECSCGARGTCVHAAAVSIVAAQRALETAPTSPVFASHQAARERGAGAGPREALPARQQLLYLLECAAQPAEMPVLGSLGLSVWVGQASATGAGESVAAIPFAPRMATPRPTQYPRYVGQTDEDILATLLVQGSRGPWRLQGRSGAQVIQQALASGRAFWCSLQSPPLRAGAARRGRLSWQIGETGGQHLGCDAGDSAAVLLCLEPPVYVDVATREWGAVTFPCPEALVRRYAGRRVSPEEVPAVNEQLYSEGNAASFPRPENLMVEPQPLSSLRGRLRLEPGPDARVQYLYNGMAIDCSRLSPHEECVRCIAGAKVCEIPRDRERERALDARLATVLPQARGGRDAWLAFLLNAAPALQSEGWEIEIAAAFPYRLARPQQWFGELESAARDSWFSLRLGVIVDGQSVNLLPALTAYLQGLPGDEPARSPEAAANSEPACLTLGEHWLMRLEDGRYLPVEMQRIRRIAATLVELFERDGLDDRERLVLPRAQSHRLAGLARELGAPTLRSQEPVLREMLAGIEELTALAPVAAPESFSVTLRPYQCAGLGWLQFLRRHRLGGVLADDMGLGKTVQALAHLLLEKEAGRLCKPALIVAPVSALANWQQEIRRLAPALRQLTLHGPGWRARLASMAGTDVVITGYPQLQLDTELLLEQDFYMVILDEAQMIKNPRARVSQAARGLRAEHRLCLTGTPVENHLGELWSLFAFAEPRLLGEEREFQRRYRAPIERRADRLRAEALAERLAPCLLRRTKDAVARELPPKSQIIETIVLDERQRDFYDAIRLASHRRIREVLDRQGLARSHITILDALLKLRQACCDPRLVAGAADQTIPSAKLEWLAAALPELAAEGRRILLFSQFTSMLRLIEAKLRQLEIPYCLLTGETRDRAAQVERFQSGGAPLFLISLKAGGTALNLTAADTVIHYDPWWNPAAEAQASDRAHRIGQTRPVFIYKLITQGTVEERMLALQEEKRALAAGVYASAAASPLALTTADLERLLIA
ncbi:MAG TPA: DEAD/DEAH box helicase [Steroidobacteraceae bacterium]|nr:DEAD/DEAH box helicase [Steroidobacteraceae bacterium]